MFNNAKSAFDNYVMWLKHYPADYKGATKAASDFIDSEGDLDELIKMIEAAAIYHR